MITNHIKILALLLGICISSVSYGQFKIDTTLSTTCQSEVLVLKSTTGPDYSNHKWFIQDVPFPVSTSNIVELTNLTTFTHFYVATADSAGITLSDTIQFFVFPSPTSVDLGDELFLCEGDSALLVDLSEELGTYSYSWDTLSQDTFVVYETGQYILTKTGPGINPCSWNDTIQVNFSPQPEITAGEDLNICYGESTQLEAQIITEGTSPYEYHWNNGTALSDSTTANPVFDTISTLTLKVIVTDNSPAACSDTDQVTVTVYSELTTTLNADNIRLCLGDSTILSGSVNGGVKGQADYLYSWNNLALLSDPSIKNPVASPTQDTEFILTATDSVGCTSSGNILINVSELSLELDETGTVMKCPSDTSILTSTIANAQGNITYSWTIENNEISISDSILAISEGWYILNATDSLGCQASDSLQVINDSTFNSQLTVTIDQGDFTICLNHDTTLSATVTGTNFTSIYSWNETNSSSAPMESETFAINSFGSYFVKATDIHGCQTFDTVTVSNNNINAPSNITVIAPDSADNNNRIIITQRFDGDGTDFLWTNSGLGFFTSATTDTTSYRPSSSDLDEIIFTLTISNECGSSSGSDTTVFSAPIVEENILYVPNTIVLSATDEDVNSFRIYGNTLTEENFAFSVYDRTGKQVFETTSLDEATNSGWNGMVEGETGNPGIYTYFVKGSYSDNQSFEKTGTVTVLK